MKRRKKETPAAEASAPPSLPLSRAAPKLARWFREALAYGALAFVTALVWMTAHGKTTAAAWEVPMGYEGDSLYNLACIQAAMEGDFHPIGLNNIRRLGAPFDGNWNDFPMYEKPVIFALGWLARGIGLFPAANAAVLIAHILSAWSFYFCCRVLRARRVFAGAGALLFAFAYYHSMRGFGHVFIAYSYTVPLALLCTWLVFSSRRLQGGSRFRRLCLGAALLLGISNPYNLAMYGQLLVLAMLAHWRVHRRRANLVTGVQCLLVAAGGFVIVNSGTFYFGFAEGPNPAALDRDYTQTERFGLKPVELVVPPADHRIGLFSRIANRYREYSLVRGEMYSPYLGGVAIAGLAWMAAAAAKRLLLRDRRALPAPPFQAAWIFFYSAIGSVNGFLALCGFALLRASNRYSIFISALALTYLVFRASGWARGRSAGECAILAALVLVPGLYDQIPKAPGGAPAAAIAKTVQADRAFFGELERLLPAGAMVYQLPVIGFPETAGVLRFEGYHHLRPYFLTRSLRFSFGSNKGRPREAWQVSAEAFPVSMLVETLEAFGFSSILLNRNGYVDGGRGLLQQLQALGRHQMAEDAGSGFVAVRLQPAARPRLPELVPPLRIEYPWGWSGAEYYGDDVQRLSDGESVIHVVNTGTSDLKVRLQLSFTSLLRCHIFVRGAAGVLWEKDFEPSQGGTIEVVGEMSPGKTVFEVRGHQPGNPDSRAAFYLRNPRAEVVPAAVKPPGQSADAAGR